MKFTYSDLISGDSIPVPGVGHIRSPHLWELMPTRGIGLSTYNLYLSVFTTKKDDLLKNINEQLGNAQKVLQNFELLETFDILVLFQDTRMLLQAAIAFFMDENLVYNSRAYVFETFSKEDNQKVGVISKENFSEVCALILQANFLETDKISEPQKFASKKAKKLWERAEKARKKLAPTDDDKKRTFGNMISKLCASSTGYTLLNIYDLTVFQLYDQYFQFSYLKAMHLTERSYSIYGGKSFKFETWENPIYK